MHRIRLCTMTLLLLGLVAGSTPTAAVDATVTVRTSNARDLDKARGVGANVDTPFLADHLRAADAGWFAHGIRGTGMRFLRWGGIHWHALEDRPINSWQWFGFQTPDDEGSFGLDEFLDLCEAEGITPIIICPFEPVPEDESTATTRADLIALTGQIAATVAQRQFTTPVYFEIGNEPWFNYTPAYYASWLDEYHDAVKAVDPSFQVCIPLPGGDYKGYAAGLLAIDGITDWFDATDTHDYPILGSGWSTYHAKDSDNFGARGTRITGKTTILGETYVIFGGWNAADNFRPAHGSNLVQLNSLLDVIDSDSVDHIAFWPSVFADSTLADGQSDEGIFQYGTWTTELIARRNTGLSTVIGIVNRSVRRHWLRDSGSSDAKLRQFVYAEPDLTGLTVVLINKDATAKQVALDLPRSYQRWGAWTTTASGLDDRYGGFGDLIPAGSPLGGAAAQLQVPGHAAVMVQLYDDAAAAAPAAFAPLDPAPGIALASTQHCFRWEAAAGASHYRLQVARDPGFADRVIDITVRGQTTWQDATVLEAGVRHHWRVRAGNAVGERTMSGGAASFLTAPALVSTHLGDAANLDLEADPLAPGNAWELLRERGSASATWDASVAHAGGHSIRFHAEQDDPSDIAIVKRTAADRLPVRPGRRYRVSAWFRGSGLWDPSAPVEQLARVGNVYVWFYDASGTTIGHRRMNGYPSWAGDTWERRLYTTIAPAGAVGMGVELRLTGVGTLWVDDLEIREYRSPTLLAGLRSDADPVSGTGTGLHALVVADQAEPVQVTWSVVAKPAGVADPLFTPNGSAAARDSVVAFAAAGSYLLRCEVSDSAGPSDSAELPLTVQQVASDLLIDPE